MTTESKTGPRQGLSPVLGALAAGTVAVLVLVVVAGLTDGRPGVLGAAVRGVVALMVGVPAVGRFGGGQIRFRGGDPVPRCRRAGWARMPGLPLG